MLKVTFSYKMSSKDKNQRDQRALELSPETEEF